jgi:hypothetical protein
MGSRAAGLRRAGWCAVAVAVLAACAGSGETTTVVRAADDVQVMSPDEVAAQRLPTLTTLASTTTVSLAPGETTPAAADTVPQNQDDRPPELRLFEAFGNFRGCLEDKGFGIEGDLLDPNNPAYQDPAYLDAVRTCAARTDIVAVLQEVQATRSSLTPEEVEQRNEVFIDLRDCLIDRGWTVETRTSEIGLLEPTVFQNPDGVLDERDINQCLSEQQLGS